MVKDDEYSSKKCSDIRNLYRMRNRSANSEIIVRVICRSEICGCLFRKQWKENGPWRTKFAENVEYETFPHIPAFLEVRGYSQFYHHKNYVPLEFLSYSSIFKSTRFEKRALCSSTEWEKITMPTGYTSIYCRLTVAFIAPLTRYSVARMLSSRSSVCVNLYKLSSDAEAI